MEGEQYDDEEDYEVTEGYEDYAADPVIQYPKLAYFLIDWEDHLFPTSYFDRDNLRECEIESFVEDFQTDIVLLESDAILLLSQIVGKGNVGICTADEELMKEDCCRYMPRLWDKLQNEWQIAIETPADDVDTSNIPGWRKRVMMRGILKIKRKERASDAVYDPNIMLIAISTEATNFLHCTTVSNMLENCHSKCIECVRGPNSPFVLKKQMELLDGIMQHLFDGNHFEYKELKKMVWENLGEGGDVNYYGKDAVDSHKVEDQGDESEVEEQEYVVDEIDYYGDGEDE